jgi:hypothetical protein
VVAFVVPRDHGQAGRAAVGFVKLGDVGHATSVRGFAGSCTRRRTKAKGVAMENR